jgi:CBS domain-containing protein
MNVEKILGQKRTIYSIQPDQPMSEAAKLMNEKQIGALIVLDEEQNIEGIVTERDLLRRYASAEGDVKHTLVRDIMTPKEKLITVNKDHSLRYVMRIMTENNIRHTPILDNSKLVGLISIRDVIKILLENAEFENMLITDYMDTAGMMDRIYG